MAVTVGSLVIDLSASTASFSKSMDKASQLSAKTATDIKKSLEKIALGLVAVGTAAATATTALVTHTTNTVAALAHLSESTGAAIGALSVMNRAAEDVGVSTEELGKGLTKLAKSAYAAQGGNADLAKVFKNVLGVSLTDANGHLKDTGVIMSEVAPAFSEMADGTTKTALAIQLFGKAGAGLIPFLNEWGKNQDEITESSKKFGLVIGNDTAANALKAKMAFNDLEEVSKGFGLQLTAAVLPAVTRIGERLVQLAVEANIPQLAASFGEKVVGAVNAFSTGLEFAVKHAQALKVAIEALIGLQVAKIAIPLVADLANGGIEKVGAALSKLVVGGLGISKIIPVLSQFAGWLKAEIWMVGALATSEGAATGAAYALRTALAAIGGPITLIIAGVSALGIAMYSLRDKTFEASGELYKYIDAYRAIAIIATAPGTGWGTALGIAKGQRVQGEKDAEWEALKKKYAEMDAATKGKDWGGGDNEPRGQDKAAIEELKKLHGEILDLQIKRLTTEQQIFAEGQKRIVQEGAEYSTLLNIITRLGWQKHVASLLPGLDNTPFERSDSNSGAGGQVEFNSKFPVQVNEETPNENDAQARTEAARQFAIVGVQMRMSRESTEQQIKSLERLRQLGVSSLDVELERQRILQGTYRSTAEAMDMMIDHLNQRLLAGGAKDGVTAFFNDMQRQAISTASIVYNAMHTAFDGIANNLTELMTGGKSNFGKMFQDIGKQMLNSTLKNAMQAGLGKIGGMLGLGSLAKRDGSSPQAALYVQMAGAGVGGVDLGGVLSGCFGGKGDDGGVSSGGFWGGLVKAIFGGGKASGGPVSPSSAYVVGENGPEILAGASGRILTNAESRGALSGGGPTYYYSIDARGTDPVLVEQRTQAAIIAAHNSAIGNSVQVSQERLKRIPQR